MSLSACCREAASASNVSIRRLKAQAIVPKEYHYEMPFEVQADGPYFQRTGLLRKVGPPVANHHVGDLTFDDPDKTKGTR